MIMQVLLVADAGQHEYLRSVDASPAHHRLLPHSHHELLPVPRVPHPDHAGGFPVVEHHFLHVSSG